jgi:adenylate kinase family enzyme
LLHALFERIAAGATSFCLLDGFPRSVDQFKTILQSYGLPVAAVVHVCVPDETRIRRASEREVRGDEPTLADRDAKDQTAGILAEAREFGLPIITVKDEDELHAALNEL